MRLRPYLTAAAVLAAVVAAPVSPAGASTAPVVTVSSTTTVAASAPAGVPFATSANAQVGVAVWGEGTGSTSMLHSVVVRGNGAAAAPTSGSIGSVPACGIPVSVECVLDRGPEAMRVSVSDDGTVVLATWRAGEYMAGYRGYSVVGSISGTTITWGEVRDFGEVGFPGVVASLSANGSRVAAVYSRSEYDPVNTFVCIRDAVSVEVATISGADATWGARSTTLQEVESCASIGHAVAINATGTRALAAWSVLDLDTDTTALHSSAVSIDGSSVTLGAEAVIEEGLTVEWLHLSSDGATAMATGYTYGANYSMDYHVVSGRLASDGTTTWDDRRQFADDAQPVYMASDMASSGSTGAVAWTTGTYNPDAGRFENLDARVLPLSIASGESTLGSATALGAVTTLTVDLSTSGNRIAIGMTTSGGGAARVGSVASGTVTLAGQTALTNDAKANHVTAALSSDGTRLLSLWRGESGQNTPLYARGATLGSAVAAPTVSGLSPRFGKADATTAVTITGAGFASGATVTVGGRAATVTSRTASQMRVTVPTGTKGNATVVVRNPDGGQATAQFTYLGKSTRTVTFSGSSTTLSQSARATAQSTATTIKNANGRFIVVTGHATGTSTAARNTATSRANAVATVLRGQGLTVTTATKTGAKETARAVVEWYS